MSEAIAQPGFIAIYRWRVTPENEARFRDVWQSVTLAARKRGALGSSLTKADNGDWVAIALWQSEEQRTKMFTQLDNLPEWPEVERLSETRLSVVEDLWLRSAG